MTKCIKCDRCGRTMASEYDHNGGALIYTRDFEGLMTEERDLCPECTIKLLKWLDSKDE